MRNVSCEPDVVKIHCDIRIKLLQEIYFKSVIYMPNVVLGQKIFQKYRISDDYIEIDLQEWSAFVTCVSSAFRDNDYIRKRISKNINKHMKNFEIVLTATKKNDVAIEKLLEYLCKLDSFSVFNMLIPFREYESTLELLEMNNNSVSDFMISAVVPHRNLLRIEKLELLKKYLNKVIKVEDYEKFFDSIGIYEEFENWLLDPSKAKDFSVVERELRIMSKTLTLCDIHDEIRSIIDFRQKNINKYLLSLNKVVVNARKNKMPETSLLGKFLFLSEIVTEEERRHMLESKAFLLIGNMFVKYDIDPSRTGINDIIRVVKGVG